MHSMDWDGFRTFLAVARQGRVSAAARQLGVEHTTVSRRLAGLEAELGVPLFHRTVGGYLLTPHGQTALADAEAMERAATLIGARARESAGKIAGRVRVALLPEYATHWLAPQLGSFRARHPAIELQILVGIQPLDLLRGEAELAVRTPRPRQVGLSALRLARAAMGAYASKGFLRGRRLQLTDAESARGLPLLLYAAPYQQLQSAAWFQPLIAAASVVLSANATETLLSAARASAGIAVLPRFVAERFEDLVSVSEDVNVGSMWLVTHPEFRRDPKVRVTAEFLRELASTLH
jgi:DNA-binding transcriptional LysR family regulator